MACTIILGVFESFYVLHSLLLIYFFNSICIMIYDKYFCVDSNASIYFSKNYQYNTGIVFGAMTRNLK